jgi:hypothetical protein
MKAAVITAVGKAPVYGDFNEPVANEGQELITVSASAPSQFSESRLSNSNLIALCNDPLGSVSKRLHQLSDLHRLPPVDLGGIGKWTGMG